MQTLKRYLTLNFSKPELDKFSTIFGLLGTITMILVTNDMIDKKLGTTIAGISGAIVSVLINNPASVKPTTEDIENTLVRNNSIEELKNNLED